MPRNMLIALLVVACVGTCIAPAASAEPTPTEVIDLAITLAKQARATEDHAKYERVLMLLSPLDTPDNTDARIPFWEAVALRHLKRLDQAIPKYALADKL